MQKIIKTKEKPQLLGAFQFLVIHYSILTIPSRRHIIKVTKQRSNILAKKHKYDQHKRNNSKRNSVPALDRLHGICIMDTKRANPI